MFLESKWVGMVRLGLVRLMVPMSLQEELFNYSNKKEGRQKNDVFPVEDGGGCGGVGGLSWELDTFISKKRI